MTVPKALEDKAERLLRYVASDRLPVDAGAVVTLHVILGEAFDAGRESVLAEQKAIAERVLAELAEPDPHPVSSQCECGGIARHAPACRWRQGYGSHVVADYRVV